MSERRSQRSRVVGEQTRLLRDLETPVSTPPRTGAELRIHVAYPNSYWVGMSNLGYQAVFSLFARSPGISVERAFLPEEEKREAHNSPWRTFETSRLIGDCDLLAFSLSFETDYPNFVRFLNKSGVLSRNYQDRDSIPGRATWGAPLILVGGTSVTLNPEPIADFVDLCFLGEAEEFVPEFSELLLTAKRQGWDRATLLRQAAQIEGVYVPRFHQAQYHESGIVKALNAMEPQISTRPKRRFVKDLSKHLTHTQILSPETEFRSMFLTETGRGCEMGCRFCVAGYIYRPVRKRSEEALAKSVEIGLEKSDAVGFVGAAVSSHRAIARLAKRVADAGARASLSSLMSQKVNRELAASLSESEYKTVALAPEAGTERLRRSAGKRVSNEQVVQAAVELAQAGIRGFKLYFIVGLPTETPADVEAIADLAILVRNKVSEAARDQSKQPWVVLSVNPFIPKACTPFQWEPMLDRKTLEKKIEEVRERVRRVPNVELHFESPKESYFQALMSRGDRRVGELLELAELEGKDWKWLLQQSEKQRLPHIPPLSFYAQRTIPYDEILPWEMVDSRIEKQLLRRENERAHSGVTEPEDGATVTEEMLETALIG